MKFRFKEKNNNVKVGDVIFSRASEYHYMIVKDFISQKHRYRLLCLDEAIVTSDPFECIDDLMNHHFSSGQYDVIPKEDVVLSN